MNSLIKGSRNSRLFNTAKAAAVKLGVGLVVPIVQVPVFLHFWQTQEYGEWIILSSIPAYLEYANIGLPSAASSDMVMRASRGDQEGALQVFSALIAAMTVLLGTACLGAAALVAFGMHASISHLATLSSVNAMEVLALLIVYVASGQFSLALTAGLNSAGANALTFKVFSFSRVAELCTIAVLLFFGKHAVGVAAGMVVVRGLIVAVQITLLRRRARWLVFSFSNVNLRILAPLMAGALGYLGWAAGNALSLQGFILVIGTAFGPVALVSFTTMRTLTRFVGQALLSINEAVFVETSVAYGAGDTAAYRELHVRAVQATLWAGSVMGVGTIFFGPYVHHVWTLGRTAFHQGVFTLLLAAVIPQAVWSSSSVSLSATNRHFILSGVFVAITAFSLSVAAAVGNRLGMAFPAAILAATDGVFAIYVIWRVLRTIDERPRHFLSQIVRPPVYLFSAVADAMKSQAR